MYYILNILMAFILIINLLIIYLLLWLLVIEDPMVEIHEFFVIVLKVDANF
jgi:hypothetical protein